MVHCQLLLRPPSPEGVPLQPAPATRHTGCMAPICLASLCSALHAYHLGHKAPAATIKVPFVKHLPESGPSVGRADCASHRAQCPECCQAWLKCLPCMCTQQSAGHKPEATDLQVLDLVEHVPKVGVQLLCSARAVVSAFNLRPAARKGLLKIRQAVFQRGTQATPLDAQ